LCGGVADLLIFIVFVSKCVSIFQPAAESSVIATNIISCNFSVMKTSSTVPWTEELGHRVIKDEEKASRTTASCTAQTALALFGIPQNYTSFPSRRCKRQTGSGIHPVPS
jgi:hypothetical protein